MRMRKIEEAPAARNSHPPTALIEMNDDDDDDEAKNLQTQNRNRDPLWKRDTGRDTREKSSMCAFTHF